MLDEYAKIAPLYENMLGMILHNMRHKVVHLCNKYHFHSLLDIGCGTGGQGLIAVENKLEFTGLDNSKAMLDQAKASLPENTVLYHLSAPELAHTIMASGKNMDVALMSLVIHEMPHEQRLQALAEAKKCVKHLIIVDYVLPERNLAIPASLFINIPERLAGKRHYSCYKDFMRRGAIEGYIYEASLITIENITMWGGALRIALTTVTKR